jgi:hypothetical protein
VIIPARFFVIRSLVEFIGYDRVGKVLADIVDGELVIYEPANAEHEDHQRGGEEVYGVDLELSHAPHRLSKLASNFQYGNGDGELTATNAIGVVRNMM